MLSIEKLSTQVFDAKSLEAFDNRHQYPPFVSKSVGFFRNGPAYQVTISLGGNQLSLKFRS